MKSVLTSTLLGDSKFSIDLWMEHSEGKSVTPQKTILENAKASFST